MCFRAIDPGDATRRASAEGSKHLDIEVVVTNAGWDCLRSLRRSTTHPREREDVAVSRAREHGRDREARRLRCAPRMFAPWSVRFLLAGALLLGGCAAIAKATGTMPETTRPTATTSIVPDADEAIVLFLYGSRRWQQEERHTDELSWGEGSHRFVRVLDETGETVTDLRKHQHAVQRTKAGVHEFFAATWEHDALDRPSCVGYARVSLSPGPGFGRRRGRINGAFASMARAAARWARLS